MFEGQLFQLVLSRRKVASIPPHRDDTSSLCWSAKHLLQFHTATTLVVSSKKAKHEKRASPLPTVPTSQVRGQDVFMNELEFVSKSRHHVFMKTLSHENVECCLVATCTSVGQVRLKSAAPPCLPASALNCSFEAEKRAECAL
jgi:hypothetical protein